MLISRLFSETHVYMSASYLVSRKIQLISILSKLTSPVPMESDTNEKDKTLAVCAETRTKPKFNNLLGFIV